MSPKSAISAIERLGMCLVFPIDGAKQPSSLWHHFFPKSKMRWEWDSGGDNRVADLWHLREELSRSGKVVYAKWYRDRATFFSIPVFAALVRRLNPEGLDEIYKVLVNPPEAQSVYQILTENSPLSTKALKRAADLEGKFNEGTYTKALKALWRRLLIVGFGEVDDGAFPSLAVGATSLLHEGAWQEALEMSEADAQKRLSAYLGKNRFFQKQLTRNLSLSRGEKNRTDSDDTRSRSNTRA